MAETEEDPGEVGVAVSGCAGWIWKKSEKWWHDVYRKKRSLRRVGKMKERGRRRG